MFTWADAPHTKIIIIDSDGRTDAPLGSNLFADLVERANAGEITIEPFVAPGSVMLGVSAAQAKVALYRTKRLADGTLSIDPAASGAPLLDAVDTAIGQYPRDVQLWYENAREWERSNAYVAGIALELGLTDDEVDSLFEYAATLSQ